MLRRKLHSETSKTKKSQAVLVRVALFWMSHCVTFGPEWLMLLHVTGSCKEPIFRFGFLSIICYVYFRAWASVLGCDVRVNVLMWFSFLCSWVPDRAKCVRVRVLCVYICVWKPNLTPSQRIKQFHVLISLFRLTNTVFYAAWNRKTILTLFSCQQKLYWEAKNIYVHIMAYLFGMHFRKISRRKPPPFGLGWTLSQCRSLTSSKICDIAKISNKGNESDLTCNN